MSSYQNVVKPLEDTYIILQSRTAAKSGTYYNWRLNNPIVINENAYLSVVERVFESYTMEANGAMPYLIRLLPYSNSVVHPTKFNSTTSINEGTIIDIAYDHRPASRAIEVKLPPQQNIDEITIQLTRTFSGSAVISSVPEFLIVLKIVEREPRVLKYGALNNIE